MRRASCDAFELSVGKLTCTAVLLTASPAATFKFRSYNKKACHYSQEDRKSISRLGRRTSMNRSQSGGHEQGTWTGRPSAPRTAPSQLPVPTVRYYVSSRNIRSRQHIVKSNASHLLGLSQQTNPTVVPSWDRRRVSKARKRLTR